jgi:hypothetical protein
MGEALQQDDSERYKDADELDEEVRVLFHGLKSEIDEGVEIRNTQ